MAEREFTGAEKSAVLLLALGDEIAPLVLKHMSEQEIQRISNYMTHLREVDPTRVEAIFEEFFNFSSSTVGLVAGGKEYVKKLLLKTLDPDKANWILNNLTLPSLETGLEALQWLDAQTIARFLQGEHPQTIAVIVAHLDPIQAGPVMSALSYTQQTDVLMRIAKLERIPPGVITELDKVLQRELKATGALETNKVGGILAVAEIL
ncbi:MAG: flagellar motor switch protein FliG, partial [Candidatus Tectomicrobia bacterium]